MRTFDVRAAVHALSAADDGFELVSAIGEPLVRPDDVVQALQQLRPTLKDTQPALIDRLEQGFWDGVEVRDPLGE